MEKKIFFIIALLISFILVSGCDSQYRTIPEDLKNVTFNQQLSVIYEDQDKYIVEIKFENKTNYDFSPTVVSVRPQIRYVKDGVDYGEPNPINLLGEQVDYGPRKYKYKIEIPKKIFDVYDHMSKDRVTVTVEGMFTKGNKIIFGVSYGEDLELIK
ncbi:hypothetical protein BHU72_12100 [Desulfuribacillus stibiiarsenatis]|uniref:Uncharacterized protein n=1 Tax=Desulfuribacillus stibiiarsenatis TaxID=1390249 RepID=A0A1E5L1V4_9FIRM|nr:hypothetical protein [Desulfuribacillus stibiiarsenatis]OEH84142.1 hypothetical protein BHU72_12100 [Desulfuribacillus stibiiarsenatis]